MLKVSFMVIPVLFLGLSFATADEPKTGVIVETVTKGFDAEKVCGNGSKHRLCRVNRKFEAAAFVSGVCDFRGVLAIPELTFSVPPRWVFCGGPKLGRPRLCSFPHGDR